MRSAKCKIGRRGVDRIAAQDQQHLDLPRAPCRSISSRERRGLIDRLGFDRGGVDDGLADVAQVVVDGVGQQVDGGRLPIAGHDERSGRGAACKIVGHGGDPLSSRAAGSRRPPARRDAAAPRPAPGRVASISLGRHAPADDRPWRRCRSRRSRPRTAGSSSPARRPAPSVRTRRRAMKSAT